MKWPGLRAEWAETKARPQFGLWSSLAQVRILQTSLFCNLFVMHTCPPPSHCFCFFTPTFFIWTSRILISHLIQNQSQRSVQSSLAALDHSAKTSCQATLSSPPLWTSNPTLLLTNIKLEKSDRITSNSKVGFPGFGVSVCWSCTSGLPSVCSPHCARHNCCSLLNFLQERTQRTSMTAVGR